MDNDFPIKINMQALLADNSQRNMALELLEAWFNFQALKQGWYASEDFILSFDIHLVTEGDFSEKSQQLNKSNWLFDDENMSLVNFNPSDLLTTGFIGLTQNDLALAKQSDSQFEACLKRKILTVINTIAAQNGLTII